MPSVEIDRLDLSRLLSALRAESDGRELRRDLVRGLRAAVEPAVALARASILAMGVRGRNRWSEEKGGSLRVAVAKATKTQVLTGRRRVGVRVRVTKHSMPRGFWNAPKRLNSWKGFRHPVFGDRENWVWERGKPGWFDDPMQAAKPAARAAAELAMKRIAERISARTRR